MAEAEFRPNWANPLGFTIGRLMAKADVTPAELARALDMTLGEMRALVAGVSPLTTVHANHLARIFGGSSQYWLKRDEQFRIDASAIPIEKRAKAEWLQALPYNDLVEFGWLKPTKNEIDRVQSLLEFFGIQTSVQWSLRYPSENQGTVFRTSRSFESRHEATASWLRQGERVASTIQCSPWNPETFKLSLKKARTLSNNRHLTKFFPELRQLCAASGVALVAAPTPSGCFASGATQFLSRNKALLLVSFRYKSDDQFWFSFFHEAAHLLLHDIDALFIDETFDEYSPQEKEANKFAQDLLIPPDRREEMLRIPKKYTDVIRYAVRIGVSPGIVVGQMQKAEYLGYQNLNGLKRRYTTEEVQAIFNP